MSPWSVYYQFLYSSQVTIVYSWHILLSKNINLRLTKMLVSIVFFQPGGNSIYLAYITVTECKSWWHVQNAYNCFSHSVWFTDIDINDNDIHMFSKNFCSFGPSWWSWYLIIDYFCWDIWNTNLKWKVTFC